MVRSLTGTTSIDAKGLEELLVLLVDATHKSANINLSLIRLS